MQKAKVTAATKPQDLKSTTKRPMRKTSATQLKSVTRVESVLFEDAEDAEESCLEPTEAPKLLEPKKSVGRPRSKTASAVISIYFDDIETVHRVEQLASHRPHSTRSQLIRQLIEKALPQLEEGFKTNQALVNVNVKIWI